MESEPAERRYLDRHRYVPHYLALIANAYSFQSSRDYLARYGVGLNEARLVAVLGHSPGLTPLALSAATRMNKSIVSRSLALMVERGLVRQDGRPRSLKNHLTDAGFGLHDHVVSIALAREDLLLQGFSAEEREQLLGMLARLLQNALAIP